MPHTTALAHSGTLGVLALDMLVALYQVIPVVAGDVRLAFGLGVGGSHHAWHAQSNLTLPGVVSSLLGAGFVPTHTGIIGVDSHLTLV